RRQREEQLRVVGVATSNRTETEARRLGIPTASLDDVPGLDLAIDGADEVETSRLGLIKGLGGALLWEKVIAQAAKRFIVIADESKLVSRLGQHAPLPVEVVQFAHNATARRIAQLGLTPRLRQAGNGPYVTDNGNYIYDCDGVAEMDAAALQRDLKTIAGVAETGLFLDMAEQAIIASPDGTIRSIRREEAGNA
ncbi:MAG: ribose 5-phosphate isomerase A, partial [Acetobacteraceae bacterium]|nr:ribose 5-phosphate isomerase A [Acetobacteraceae bacterium]